MNVKQLLASAAAVAATIAAVPAGAVTYEFKLTGDYTSTFYIDSNPTVDAADDTGFSVFDVNGSFPGATPDYVSDVTFYNTANGGGLQIDDFFGGTSLFGAIGPQLFSGTESSPVLTLGTFALTEFGGNGKYTLNVGISPVTPVPEPTTWAYFLVGFGAVGAATRYRRRKTVAVVAA